MRMAGWIALAAAGAMPLAHGALTTAPLVLYTDIASGPNSGGENNAGAYLSIFGKNFGAGGLGQGVQRPGRRRLGLVGRA